MSIDTSTDTGTTEHSGRYVLRATGELLPAGFKPSTRARIDADLSEDPLPTWHDQPLLSQAFVKHDRAVFCRDGSGLIPMTIKGFVRIRTARVVNCKICSNTRNATARNQGVTEETLSKVTDDFEQSDLAPDQKLAIRYADVVLFGTPPSEELRRQMAERFTPEQILELTVFVSQCRTFASVGIALGIQPDEMSEVWVH